MPPLSMAIMYIAKKVITRTSTIECGPSKSKAHPHGDELPGVHHHETNLWAESVNMQRYISLAGPYESVIRR